MTTNEITIRKQQIAFPTVAIIRKGGPKQQRTKNGKTYETVGKDLDQHFRVVFEPGMETYQERFLKLYGTLTPTTINAMLPFNDLSACYEISAEAYQAGMLAFKAVNGQVIVHRDPTNGEYLVRNGEAKVDSANLIYDPYEMPNLSYVGHDGTTKVLPIKANTRVKLFIPEMEDFVWFLLKSNSYYDSLNIMNNIAAVQAVAESATGGRVAGVRINVFRALQSILWNSPQGPRRIDKWLLNVKIDPSWVKQMVSRMSASTLGAGTQVQELLAPPANAPDPDEDQDTSEVENDDNEEPIEGEIINTDDQETAPALKEVTRPYSPEVLRTRLIEHVGTYSKSEATDKQRNLFKALFLEYFGGDENKRHAVQNYLFGNLSLNDFNDAEVLAALDWLKPEKNKDGSGNFIISDYARKELASVSTQALEVQGQKALF